MFFFLKSKKCTDYVNVKNKQKYLRIIDMSIKNCSQNKKNEKRIESKGGKETFTDNRESTFHKYF